MKATRIALATALLCTSAMSMAASDYPGQANTSHQMAINYHHAQVSENSDIDLSATTVSYAYQMRNPGGDFTFGPEISIGSGADKFREGGLEMRVDGLAQLGVRLTYHPCDHFHVFLKPTISKLWMSAEMDGVDILGDEDTSSESGVTFGVGFDFSERYALEFSAEKIGDLDVVTGSFRYRF